MLGMPGPRSMPVKEYLSQPYKGRVRFLDEEGLPRAGYDYIAYKEDKAIARGTTDQDGWTEVFLTATMEDVHVHLLLTGFEFEHQHDEECGC